MSFSSAERHAHLQPDLPGSPDARDSDSELRQQVAERLAAHRARRNRSLGPEPVSAAQHPPRQQRSNRIAEAVAERYAQSQSYRDFLAAEAQRAIDEANIAAEIAARNAQAIAIAQQQLLADLDHWNQSPAAPVLVPARREPEPQRPIAPVLFEMEMEMEMGRETAIEMSAPEAAVHLTPDLPAPIAHPAPIQRAPRAATQTKVAGLTVRLFENATVPVAPRPSRAQAPSTAPLDEEERQLLDDEIAFRRDPVFAEPAEPLQPIAANLIEFPRQLVAPRRSRPRLAEGPLRDEADASPAAAQLRIFEVEAEQISLAPAAVESVLPEWSSIHLDTPARNTYAAEADHQIETVFALPPQVAHLSLRLMAALVDGCLLTASFLGFVTTVALTARQLPTGALAAATAAATFLVLFVLYQFLFFTVSDATPGMRYARIALCTFADENPSRSAMRRRTFALLLAACPLGIGLLWAILDDDRMGWHDRISRMYQRAY